MSSLSAEHVQAPIERPRDSGSQAVSTQPATNSSKPQGPPNGIPLVNPPIPDIRQNTTLKSEDPKRPSGNEGDHTKAKLSGAEALVLQKFDPADRKNLKNYAQLGSAYTNQLLHPDCDPKEKGAEGKACQKKLAQATKDATKQAKDLSKIIEKKAPRNLSDKELDILDQLLKKLHSGTYSDVFKTIADAL